MLLTDSVQISVKETGLAKVMIACLQIKRFCYVNLLGPVWRREIICGGSAHTSYTTFLLMLRRNSLFLL